MPDRPGRGLIPGYFLSFSPLDSALATITSGQPSPSLRLGIAGCLLGRPLYGDLLRALPEFQIAALADADLSAAQAWARALPGRPFAADTLAPLLALVPRLDGVLVTVRTPKERETACRACLEARLPTLVSLPLTASLSGSDALAQAGRTAQTWILPAFVRRFDPVLPQLDTLLNEEVLGSLRSVRCDLSVPALPAFGIPEEEAGTAAGWREMLFRTACQSADLCRLWLGDARTVSADIEGELRDLPVRARGRAEIYPVANLIVTHERGQATHHIARARSVYLREQYTLTGSRGRLEWTCSAGEAAATSTTPSLVLFLTGRRPERIPLSTPKAGASKGAQTSDSENLLRHFAACLRAEATPQASIETARAALEIVLGAYLSSREDVKVSLPFRER